MNIEELIKISKPARNDRYEEQLAKKKEAEKSYEFLLKYQGITPEYDEVLEQLRVAIESWSIYPVMYTIKDEDLTKFINDEIKGSVKNEW